MKNYGFNLELELAQQSEKDWEYVGSVSDPCIALIPEVERTLYLPEGEIQRTEKDDMMDCASRSVINILAPKFTYLYRTGKMSQEGAQFLLQNGYLDEKTSKIDFSDAFVAINSGTTRRGNSLKAPIEATRKMGLIPKKMLPLEPWMSFEDYHNPNRITKAMLNLGYRFAERFEIHYEKVFAASFGELLTKDFIDVAGHAWPEPIGGSYPKTELPINHSFVLFKNPKYQAFDNYVDSVDGDFVKSLDPDYKFMDYGYRVYISREITAEQRKSWAMQLLEIIKTLLGIQSAVLKTIETKPMPEEREESPTEKLYRVSKESLDKKLSPKNPKLGCAEALNAVHKLAFGDEIGGGQSSYLLHEAIKKRKDFVQIDKYEPGAVIVSPTGSQPSTSPIDHGHVGICGKFQIMSNNSNTGAWDTHFTKTQWERYFKERGGFPIYYFKKV